MKTAPLVTQGPASRCIKAQIHSEKLSIEVAFFIGTFVVGFAIIGVLAYLADKKRKEALEALAKEMGLEFFPDGNSELEQQLSGFNLMNRGYSKKLNKLILGQTDDVTIAIFDYCYTTGSGKNRSRHSQTVASLQSNQLSHCDFTMRPEGFMDSIGGALGFQDIDFESHPNFSNMFVLKGDSEEAVRSRFQPAVLEYFEDKPGVSVESHAGNIILYRTCLLYTSPSPRDQRGSRMPSSA